MIKIGGFNTFGVGVKKNTNRSNKPKTEEIKLTNPLKNHLKKYLDSIPYLKVTLQNTVLLAPAKVVIPNPDDKSLFVLTFLSFQSFY